MAMARPIKETPVLTGKDAESFQKALEANRNAKVSRESYDRAVKTFESIKLVINKPIGA
jgi:hypothetical protein